MTRTEIINLFIEKNNYKSYLEIGVQNGKNFYAVKCENKTGVDPDPNSKAILYLTSDVFFERAKKLKQKFDIIFIDGLHHAEQVHRDIFNSLECLSKGGVIVLHDMNPTSEAMQKVPRVQTEWTGDCWKAFVHFRTAMPYKAYVIDTDYGVGIISKANQSKLKANAIELNYELFNEKRKEWLNLISTEKFLQVMNQPKKQK